MSGLGPISSREFEKFLQHVGCRLKRQKGDHLMYDKLGLKRPVVVCTGRQLSVNEIMSNLRTLGMDSRTYLDILKDL